MYQPFICRLQSGANYPDWTEQRRVKVITSHTPSGVGAHLGLKPGLSPVVIHSTKSDFSVVHRQTNWNRIPSQNDAPFSKVESRALSFPWCLHRTTFHKEASRKKTLSGMCFFGGKAAHSSRIIAVDIQKIELRPDLILGQWKNRSVFQREQS